MKISTFQGSYFHKKDHHIYIKPDPLLQDMIAHYTITFPSDVPTKCENYRILPDGSGCIIFQECESIHVDFWGAMDKVVVLKNDINEVNERFFVEFLPTGLYQISGNYQKKYINMRAPLRDFDIHLSQQLDVMYKNCKSFDDVVKAMNSFFLKIRKANPLSQRFVDALEIIHQAKGKVQMKELAHILALSTRQLSRDFDMYLGLPGKTFANIVRFNIMLKEMDEDFLTTALRHGYFDQSHFNKDFKRIVNISPKEYKQNLSDFYNEVYKF